MEAAGDVSVLLLDKTAPLHWVTGRQPIHTGARRYGGTIAEASQLASLADETPEGRSIVVLAKKYGLRGRSCRSAPCPFLSFSAQTRMSGVDCEGRSVEKGQHRLYENSWERNCRARWRTRLRPFSRWRHRWSWQKTTVHWCHTPEGYCERRFTRPVRAVSNHGNQDRHDHGDNRVTAAAIAEEAGVDDFLAEAKPEDKLALIRSEQALGHLVAMTGDGTNDALHYQADVGVAMNTGTQAAKEAGMVDLDSNPTKLIEIVEIGKQMLMTRGHLPPSV